MVSRLSDLSLIERRAEIMRRLDDAVKLSGRKAGSCALVAVSKQQPDDRIAEMLGAGQTIFGENRVQEADARWADRFSSYRDKLELRLIGPLQTNKAAEAVRLFDVIETLDREKLARALIKAAEEEGRLPRLYVQVNTGAEPQKSGVLPADLGEFIRLLRAAYGIEPEGLMCIPPAGEAPSPHFWWLSNLAAENGLQKLSMGMSGDYEVAAEMGATSVRVGSALFGEREA